MITTVTKEPQNSISKKISPLIERSKELHHNEFPIIHISWKNKISNHVEPFY
jgi:hypothetical protein